MWMPAFARLLPSVSVTWPLLARRGAKAAARGESFPIISQDSPLRRLPHGLGAKRIVFLDALRVSAEIAGQAYEDLVGELRLLGKQPKSDQTRKVRVVRHAWTFVDAVHRFRVVLRQAPGIRHNHVYELFMRRTKIVTDMRNKAQHLNRELAGIAKRSQGAYGTLTWVLGAGEHRVPKPVMLNIGSAYGRVVGPVTDLHERLPDGELHRVRLELADCLLMLPEAHEHLSSLVRSLEAPVASSPWQKGLFVNRGSCVRIDLSPVSPTTNPAHLGPPGPRIASNARRARPGG